MTRAELDAGYDNMAAVAGASSLLAEFRRRSDRLYRQVPCEAGIAYGNLPANRLDYFPVYGDKVPTLIFIHGGYWQKGSKEDFAFISAGPLACGYQVIQVEYTLAPHATMKQIVAEISACLDFILAHSKRFHIKPGQVCLSGHSAGGHLSLVHKGHPLVSHVLSLSPLVDLTPIQRSFLDDRLKLSVEEVKHYSPLFHIEKGIPVTIAAGADELPELIAHAHTYAASLLACGNNTRLLSLPEHDHFSLLEELASPKGTLTLALTELFAQSP